MAAQNSQGIQILLEAEKEAAKIVQKGRQYRVQKLKDAKTEAQKDIDALKAAKQAEFDAKTKGTTGGTDESLAQVDAWVKDKLARQNTLFEQNKESVLEKLLASVTLVAPKIHPNALPKRKVPAGAGAAAAVPILNR